MQDSVPNVTFQSEAEKNNCFEAITKLLQKGAIREYQPCENQFISSYFLTPKPDDSFRFTLNLKKLNKFIDTQHFKMEDMRSVLKLLRKNAFMVTPDLEDAYLLVPIHADSTKYLRFLFNSILYEFIDLSFGLCVSPYIYIKVVRPIVKYLRVRGYIHNYSISGRLVVYRRDPGGV